MTPSPIDRRVLDELIAVIGVEGTRSVIELFIGETAAHVATIAEAAAQPADATRRERARRAAHSLKSGAGQIGAAAVAAAAIAVEAAASGRAGDLAQSSATLNECTAATMKAFQEMLALDRTAGGLG